MAAVGGVGQNEPAAAEYASLAQASQLRQRARRRRPVALPHGASTGGAATAGRTAEPWAAQAGAAEPAAAAALAAGHALERSLLQKVAALLVPLVRRVCRDVPPANGHAAAAALHIQQRVAPRAQHLRTSKCAAGDSFRPAASSCICANHGEQRMHPDGHAQRISRRLSLRRPQLLPARTSCRSEPAGSM